MQPRLTTFYVDYILYLHSLLIIGVEEPRTIGADLKNGFVVLNHFNDL